MTSLAPSTTTVPTLTTADGVGLPLTDVTVAVQVDGFGHETTITQVFGNDFDAPIEVTYTFPLPGTAAVHGCSIRIGDRVLDAELKELEQAREEYQTAIDEGFTASLIEQHGSEVFQIRVGNISPHTEIEIHIVLHGEVVVDTGPQGVEATVRIPTLVAPKYSSSEAPTNAVDTNALPRGAGASRDTTTSATITVSGAVAQIDCPTHLASSTTGILELHDLALDRDIIWRWAIAEGTSEARWVADDDSGSLGTLEVVVHGRSLTPDDGNGRRPQHVTVLVDRSGSMGGWGQSAANNTAVDIVRALSPGDTINVISFDTSFEVLPACTGSPVQVGTRQQRDLIDQINAITARGGTDLVGALQFAATLFTTDSERDNVLVLITDGHFANESEAVRLRNTLLASARVLVIGIDMAVSGGFLTELAAGSYVELIESAHRRSEVSTRICERLNTPVHQGLTIEGVGELTTERGIDVYPGQLVRIAGRCPRPTTPIVLNDRHGNTIAVPVQVASDPSIRTRWATARLTLLEHADADVADIVALSLAHTVQCRHTAWIVVDRDGTVHDAPPLPITQPLDWPAGWSPQFMACSPVASMALMSLPDLLHSNPFDIGPDGADLDDLDDDIDDPFESEIFVLVEIAIELERTGVLTEQMVVAIESIMYSLPDAAQRRITRLDLRSLLTSASTSLERRTSRRVAKVLRGVADQLPASAATTGANDSTS